MAKKLKVWNGASWEDVTFAITPPTTNVTNEFSTNQVIDASTSVAALRITQRGTGEALRVEDSTNPDASSFVITSIGHVGFLNSSPARPIHIITDGSVPAGTGAMIIEGNYNNERIVLRSVADPVFETQMAGGTITSPTATTVGMGLGRIQFGGYDGSLWQTNRTRVGGRAAENWTPTATGSEIFFMTTTIGTTSVVERMTIDGRGQTYLSSAQDISAWRIRNTYASTSAPSGGNDGDIWAVYV